MGGEALAKGMSAETAGLYAALLGRILTTSRAYRALPRLPCAPPPRLGDYEALLRRDHAPESAARARAVAAVFVEELRPLTPAQRSEAMTGCAGHAPLFTDAWAAAAGAAWVGYATLLAVVAQSPTPEAALLHLAETEPDAFWTQVWRWLLMQHVGDACDARVLEFKEWLCARVIVRAHPSLCAAWALFDEEQRRCESLGLWLNLPSLMALLARHQIARAAGDSAHARKKRGRSAPSAV